MEAAADFRIKWTSVQERKRLLATLVVITASVAGFLTQLTQVSLQYFKYRTTTQVTLWTPPETAFHATALCISYHDILDEERLYNETGIQWKKWDSLKEASELETQLTVEQIFRFTPEPIGIIQVIFGLKVTERPITRRRRLFFFLYAYPTNLTCYFLPPSSHRSA